MAFVQLSVEEGNMITDLNKRIIAVNDILKKLGAGCVQVDFIVEKTGDEADEGGRVSEIGIMEISVSKSFKNLSTIPIIEE